MSQATAQLTSGFVVKDQDGTTHVFATKPEALDYMRKPQVIEALNALTSGNAELSGWLYANREEIEASFELDKIRRVTKAEYKKLEAALEHIKTAMADSKEAGFVVQNADAIKESFRWPKVARLTTEEAEKQIYERLTKLATGEDGTVNTDLVNWMVAQKEPLGAAYAAGIVKREVSEKAASGLAEYQAKKKAAAAVQYAATKFNLPAESLRVEGESVLNAEGVEVINYATIAAEKEAAKAAKGSK